MSKMNLTIKLIEEHTKDKKGKNVYVENRELNCPNCSFVIREKLEEKEPLYKQQDTQALMKLSSFFDSRKYSLKEYKQYIKLRNKIEEAWLKNNKTLELSLDEASLLKKFLISFFEKDNKEKQLIDIFMGRTITSILDQLEA